MRCDELSRVSFLAAVLSMVPLPCLQSTVLRFECSLYLPGELIRDLPFTPVPFIVVGFHERVKLAELVRHVLYQLLIDVAGAAHLRAGGSGGFRAVRCRFMRGNGLSRPFSRTSSPLYRQQNVRGCPKFRCRVFGELVLQLDIISGCFGVNTP